MNPNDEQQKKAPDALQTASVNECHLENDEQTPTCCSQLIRQYADIQASVKLHPSARLGKVETTCCGEPAICCRKNRQKEICEITITQKVCVKIPICYGVTADVEDSSIRCHGSDNEPQA